MGKINIGLYTVTYLGIWYDGPGLSFKEIVKRAKQYGYKGIELDNKRPHGNPMDLDRRKRDEIRNLMEKEGMVIPCVAANNDFSSPIPEHRECQLLMVKETVRLAADLGAKVVRLFAAWTGVPIHEGFGTYDLTKNYYSFQGQYPYATWLDRWNHTKACLKEAAAFGEEFGVTLALQNHPPLTRHWKDTYDLVKDINSPWLKMCLDLPMLTRYDREWVEEAVRTVGDLQVHSHFGGEFEKDEDGVIQIRPFAFGKPAPDYAHCIKMMDEIGYEGFFTYELCHPFINEKREWFGLADVDVQAQLAAEYLQNILDKR